MLCMVKGFSQRSVCVECWRRDITMGKEGPKDPLRDHLVFVLVLAKPSAMTSIEVL